MSCFDNICLTFAFQGHDCKSWIQNYVQNLLHLAMIILASQKYITKKHVMDE